MMLDYPATQRNREPIAAVLRDVLPERGTVLEVAAGSGQHGAHFAPLFPHLQWQPTDPEPDARNSIAAWRDQVGVSNLLEPLELDARWEPARWPVARASAVVNINMIHISPWAACLGLLAGAAELLPAGAPLYFYGPFVVDGVPTAPSNVRFDESLRARNAEWGVRRLADVSQVAAAAGFTFDRSVQMPANNMSVIFRRD